MFLGLSDGVLGQVYAAFLHFSLIRTDDFVDLAANVFLLVYIQTKASFLHLDCKYIIYVFVGFDLLRLTFQSVECITWIYFLFNIELFYLRR